ncbi:MAG: hypothetical protein GEU79_17825 [Acidimicrobiia bacterium]|nr:hypothetical protein [Acidimicrobiia bacterium]
MSRAGSQCDNHRERYLSEPADDFPKELRNNLTICDAAYVALAELLETPLVTADAGIAEASGPMSAIDVLESEG